MDSHLSLSSFFFAALSKRGAPNPLHTLVRAATFRLSPPRPRVHPCQRTCSWERARAGGQIEPRQLATILVERRLGGIPTIVLGGFVPDAVEQVFLLRGHLLRQGSVYYFTYPKLGFSMDAACAQLDDLVHELNERHGQAPVLFSVSFGCGVAMEWLRRSQGRHHELSGLVLVSPVACAEDLIARHETKPSTLLGRAVKPFLDAGVTPVSSASIEKSRAIFTRMFESGAQNREQLLRLMTAEELVGLKSAVLGSIRTMDAVGACERVAALKALPVPEVPRPGSGPLSEVPTLVLYAEKESSVLTDTSPTRAVFEQGIGRLFPDSHMAIVTGDPDSPVQHASLIFHYPHFRGPVTEFYQRLKSRKIRLAA